jgi:hypothetical protein
MALFGGEWTCVCTVLREARSSQELWIESVLRRCRQLRRGFLWIAKAEEVEHIIWRDDKVGYVFLSL